MDRQEKRVVIVTGSSQGLGREIALRFGRTGDRVIVNYLSSGRDAEETAREITHAGGEGSAFRADVRNSAEAESMISDTARRWGRIDVLVNNAGIAKDGLMVRMPEQDWDDVIDTNLKGPFNCIRAAAKTMIKQRDGHIINISSITGVHGREGQANYSSSKAGLIGLTKAAAKELGRFNIKVNAVLPGYLRTDMGDRVSDDVLKRIINENALGRASDPKEAAEFIHHISLMNNISGQVFNLDSRMF